MLNQEKQKKINEGLTTLIFDAIPRLDEYQQFKKVAQNVHRIFIEREFVRKKAIIKENEKSDTIYIIKSGQCAMFKYIETKDNLGIPRQKHEKIINLEPGTIFGEDTMILGKGN